MKTKLFILTVSLALFSCKEAEQKDVDILPYYQFESAELQKIPAYTDNQQLVFANDSGTQLVLIHESTEVEAKKVYGEGMGFLGPYAAEYFYYDTRVMKFKRESDMNTMCLSFTKWPIDLDSAKKGYVKQPSKLMIEMSKFPYWNGLNQYNNPEIFIDLKDYTERVSLTIAGKTYTDVLKMTSNNDKKIDDVKSANVIYYKDGIGILGFDDLQGNHWRLK